MRLHRGIYAHRQRICNKIWLWEKKNPLPYWGIEPALAVCPSDALPTELHPHPALAHKSRPTGKGTKDWWIPANKTFKISNTARSLTTRNIGCDEWGHVYSSACWNQSQINMHSIIQQSATWWLGRKLVGLQLWEWRLTVQCKTLHRRW